VISSLSIFGAESVREHRLPNRAGVNHGRCAAAKVGVTGQVVKSPSACKRLYLRAIPIRSFGALICMLFTVSDLFHRSRFAIKSSTSIRTARGRPSRDGYSA
jgi:hypothetical protein